MEDTALLGRPMLRPPSKVAPRGSVPVLAGTQLPGSSASEPRRRMESPSELMAGLYVHGRLLPARVRQLPRS